VPVQSEKKKGGVGGKGGEQPKGRARLLPQDGKREQASEERAIYKGGRMLASGRKSRKLREGGKPPRDQAIKQISKGRRTKWEKKDEAKIRGEGESRGIVESRVNRNAKDASPLC